MDPVLHEAWGPLLSPEENALICGNDDPADAGAGDQGPRYVEAAGERAGAGSTDERGGLVCEAAARSGGQQGLSVAYDELGGFGGCARSGGRGTVADERGGIVSGASGTVASDSEAVVHWISKAPFRLQLNAATVGSYTAGVQGAMDFFDIG